MEVVGLIGASQQLITSVYRYSKDFKSARKDRERLLKQIYAIKTSLSNVQDYLSELKSSQASIPQGLEELISTLTLNEDIESLNKKLSNQDSKHKWTKRFKWHFISEDMKEDLHNIKTNRDILDTYLSDLGRKDVREVKKGQQGLKKTQDKAEKDRLLKEVMKWLLPLEHRHDQTSVDTYPVSKWLFSHPEYKLWAEGKTGESYLWLWGDPGVGKSVLSLQVMNTLKQNSPKKENLVLHLTMSQENPGRRLEYLIGSLLRQRMQFDKSSVPLNLLERLNERSAESPSPGVNEVLSDLKNEFNNFNRVYLIIDGWNYIGNDIENRFRDCIQDLAKIPKVSPLVTSIHCEDEFAKRPANCTNCLETEMKIFKFCRVCHDSSVCVKCADNGQTCGKADHEMIFPDRLPIVVNPTDEEIKNYVKWELNRLRSDFVHQRQMYEDRGASDLTQTPVDRLIEECGFDVLIKMIVGRSAGNYGDAKRYIEHITQDWFNREEIDGILSDPPEDLATEYGKTMDRLLQLRPKRAKSRIQQLKFALYWISCTKRILSLPELQQAKDICIGTDRYTQTDDFLDEKDLILFSESLISVNYIEQSSVHIPPKLAIYLQKHQDRYFGIDYKKDIALRLLTCLNYDIMGTTLDDDAAIDATISSSLPLLSYACEYWHEHVRPVQEDHQVQEQLLKFLNNPTKIDNYIRFVHGYRRLSLVHFDVQKGLNGLHIASCFGLLCVIPALLPNIDVNSVDPKYRQSALHYAARYGHVDTVKKLVESGADVNIKSERGKTALFEAYAEKFQGNSGHDEIVWLMIRNESLDINCCNEQDSRRSLLMMAARFSDQPIVEAVLKRESVDPNIRDEDGHTALLLAIYFSENVEIIKSLLGHTKIALDLPNVLGETALLAAIRRGKSEVINLLLNAGADPTICNPQSGSCAIQRAIEAGNIAMLNVFLRNSASLAIRDNDSRTLLHYCSEYFNNEIAQKLLDAGLDIDSVDSRGRTPLHEACRAGNLDAVKLLLDHGADKTKKDNNSRTPLTVARQNTAQTDYCHIQALLDPPSPSSPSRGQSAPYEPDLPIWSLVKVGLMDELRSRLTTGLAVNKILEKDPDTGNTALHWAVILDEPAFLKVLLAASVPQDSTNDSQETPLLLAITHNRFEMFDMLLTHADPPFSIPNAKNMLPLECAQRRTLYNHAVWLISHGADAATTNRAHLDETFFSAVYLKNARAAELLIKAGADHLKVGKDGKTAKQLAVSLRDEEMLRVLAAN